MWHWPATHRFSPEPESALQAQMPSREQSPSLLQSEPAGFVGQALAMGRWTAGGVPGLTPYADMSVDVVVGSDR